MLETVGQILEWVAQYGADTVFMVFFFILYLKANKRSEKLQDKRLDDNKKALEALIEARHALEHLEEANEHMGEKVDKIYEKVIEQKAKEE
jgi:hypothetical protein